MSAPLSTETVIQLNRKLAVELWALFEEAVETDMSNEDMDSAARAILEEFGNSNININTHDVVWTPAFGGSYDIIQK